MLNVSDASQKIPLWWQEIFPAGPQDGFFRNTGEYAVSLVKRDADRLLISLEGMPPKGTKFRQDGLAAAAAQTSGRSHLALFLSPSKATKKTLSAILAELEGEGVFTAKSDCVVALAGLPATLALAVKNVARILLLEPSERAAKWPKKTSPVTVFYDPLVRGQNKPAQLPEGGLHLRMPLLHGGFEAALAALDPNADLMAKALEGNLTAKRFHQAIRARKSLPTYLDRIQGRLQRFQGPVETPVWPRERGNVWMLEKRGDRLLYMSDRWAGRTIGFEERDGVTLAQTPPVLHGILSIGDWCGISRALPERFPWHVVDHDLKGGGPDYGARAQGAILAEQKQSRGEALPGVVALDIPQAGSVPKDFGLSGKIPSTIEERLRLAVKSAAAFGRQIHVERVSLGMLAGATQINLEQATDLYCDFIQWLKEFIPLTTGQAALPIFVLTQSAGQRNSGTAESILAEGRLDMELTSNLVVASPAYPYPLMTDMPLTPDPVARLLMDEIEGHAVHALQEGGRWFCPRLRQATLKDNLIRAAFTTMGPLVLENGPHGFQLDGCENDSQITSVQVDKARSDHVILEFDKPPQGKDMKLSYAWGYEQPVSERHAANCGALRDGWMKPSRLVSGQNLHRFALSARVRVT